MKKLQKIFLAGILTILPVFITFYLIHFLFTTLDGLVGGFLEAILNRRLPGVGVISSLLLILLVGLLTTNLLGKKIIGWSEAIITKIPLIKKIYTSIKHIIDAFSSQGKDAFKTVVLLEYPRQGIYVLGFVTGKARGEIQQKTTENLVNVFIPTTPNPTSGMLVFLPEESLIPLDLSVEDGLKMLISGGIATPD